MMPKSYDAGDYPQALATADLSGDGRNDAVAADLSGSTVGVLPATATGAMQPPAHSQRIRLVRHRLPSRGSSFRECFSLGQAAGRRGQRRVPTGPAFLSRCGRPRVTATLRERVMRCASRAVLAFAFAASASVQDAPAQAQAQGVRTVAVGPGGTIGLPLLDDAGRTQFGRRLDDGGTGIFRDTAGTVALLFRDEFHPPGTPDDVRVYGFSAFQMSGTGRMTFGAWLRGNSVTQKNDRGIWQEGAGGLALLAAPTARHRAPRAAWSLTSFVTSRSIAAANWRSTPYYALDRRSSGRASGPGTSTIFVSSPQTTCRPPASRAARCLAT